MVMPFIPDGGVRVHGCANNSGKKALKGSPLQQDQRLGEPLVRLSGDVSNQIFAELENWEQVLKDTSLARPPKPPAP
jgi:hypothetical protein